MTALEAPHSSQSLRERTYRYGAWRASTWACETLCALAVVALLSDVAIVGLTFASPTVAIPDLVILPFFGFAIVGTIVAVLLVATARRREVFRDIWRLPKWILVLIGVIGVASVSTQSRTFAAVPPGQPGYDPHRNVYYFDDHGFWIIVSRARYLSGVASEIRGFLTPAAALTCVAVLVLSAEVYRRSAVTCPRWSEIPTPAPPRPRLCPHPLVGVLAVVVGLSSGAIGLGVITHRTDTFADGARVISSGQLTLHLAEGQWDVYGRCETRAAGVPYGCPTLTTSDVVVRALRTGALLTTAVDRTPDQTALEGLPSEGLLTFTVVRAGPYRVLLTRNQPRGLFVAPTRAVILRSLLWVIVLSVLGAFLAILGVVLLVRRGRWRLRLAPPVIDTGLRPRAPRTTVTYATATMGS